MSFFDVLWWVLVILYIPACIGLITIVLLQKGKGTGFAGAFGLGAGADTVFGPRSRQSLPVRLTYVAATLFMVIALLMSIIAGKVGKGVSPELVEAASEEAILESTLSDLGIGTGKVSDVRAPAPVDRSARDAKTPGAAAPATNAADGESSDGAEPSGEPGDGSS